MREQESEIHRAISVNGSYVAPLRVVRATIGRDDTGSLQVSNRSLEVADPLSQEERERRQRVAQKVNLYLSGQPLAFDEEVRAHYEAERDQFFSDLATED